MAAGEEGRGVKKGTWTTWEELLLACAVKRHGLNDWDSVTAEIQTRTSLPLSLTPQICRNKYHELKRRFMDNDKTDDDAEVEDSAPWIEELRKLRVAELKQEVHRYDLSIQSLQLKVKRLEEERERSLKEEVENDSVKPDLAVNSEEKRSETDKNNGGRDEDRSPAAEIFGGKSVSGEHSNWSFNESNSTANREIAGESEPVRACAVKTDPPMKACGGGREDSCNGSSDTVAKHLVLKPSQAKKESDELIDSVSESKEWTKESSDVHSSASLTKRKTRRTMDVAGGGDEAIVVYPASAKRDVAAVKSETLVGILDAIRAHKHGSMFERRLDGQKTEMYKSLIRQHVDLRMVQTRIDDGSYSSSNAKFFLDLLLLFSNAVVLFPKSSLESNTACELRDLVLKEMRKSQKPDSSFEAEPLLVRQNPDKEKPVSLLANHKSAASIVVCRKRSSMKEDGKPVVLSKPHPKPSSSDVNDEDGPIKAKPKEKPVVTGARTMRRGSNNNRPNSIVGKGVDAAAKAEKKKVELTPTVSKKRGAADFLKRIKKNSPSKGAMETTKADDSGGNSRKDQQKKRTDDRKEGVGRQRGDSGGGGGGGGRQQAKEESSPSKKNIGRPPKRGAETIPAKRAKEVGEPDSGSKRPAKRLRR